MQLNHYFGYISQLECLYILQRACPCKSSWPHLLFGNAPIFICRCLLLWLHLYPLHFVFFAVSQHITRCSPPAAISLQLPQRAASRKVPFCWCSSSYHSLQLPFCGASARQICAGCLSAWILSGLLCTWVWPSSFAPGDGIWAGNAVKQCSLDNWSLHLLPATPLNLEQETRD